ncbi:hypothetical protein CC1G_09678 [Coprinopsis cinerea okayama7|uniref:Uncharacterized protein n=1 Tax=Coprinopsis cinerea (strain Okayama-7 / 130 / ATCC MYA-4618 / FGSC 9003) TaxID=240176 RepID=A8P9H8_COPC7|nr:hypothetical protein CC1G_09678 [Coprinopsis cinerea okayama7\|eukprot:XP_001839775.1 hypothetical protein CC1G_09678 [Coprinopsis cinerea okayama7\
MASGSMLPIVQHNPALLIDPLEAFKCFYMSPHLRHLFLLLLEKKNWGEFLLAHRPLSRCDALACKQHGSDCSVGDRHLGCRTCIRNNTLCSHVTDCLLSTLLQDAIPVAQANELISTFRRHYQSSLVAPPFSHGGIGGLIDNLHELQVYLPTVPKEHRPSPNLMVKLRKSLFDIVISRDVMSREVQSLVAMLHDIATIVKICNFTGTITPESAIAHITTLFLQHPGFSEPWMESP